MAYFTKDIINFFKELEKNNNKIWFDQNKSRYENTVKKPFEKFIEEMIARLHTLDPEINMTAKDAVFRIYRDVRFSKDKTPYKTNASALISAGGKKDKSHPGYYIELNPNELRLYGGVYMVDSKTLQRIREYIANHLAEFDKAIHNKNFKMIFGEIHGEKNKRITKELESAGEKQPLIYNKSFYYFVKLPTVEIYKNELPENIIKHYKAAEPVKKFLTNAIFG